MAKNILASIREQLIYIVCTILKLSLLNQKFRRWLNFLLLNINQSISLSREYLWSLVKIPSMLII